MGHYRVKAALALQRFKTWAASHSLHHHTTKLPWRLTVRMHEEVVDFIHGTIIGLFLGFIIGQIILRAL